CLGPAAVLATFVSMATRVRNGSARPRGGLAEAALQAPGSDQDNSPRTRTRSGTAGGSGSSTRSGSSGRPGSGGRAGSGGRDGTAGRSPRGTSGKAGRGTPARSGKKGKNGKG